MTELLHNSFIREINFEKILPLWKLLWPNTNNILQMSSMKYLGGYDISIYNKYYPTFFGLYINQKLIGCISGHKSSHEYYRIRGIYILPEYRNNGYSKFLFKAIIDQAKKENSTFIWSFPKKKSIKSYISVGFQQTSKFITTNTSQNCFVIQNSYVPKSSSEGTR